MNANDGARNTVATIATGFLTLLAGIALFELLIQSEVIDPFVMPPPSEVFGAFGRIWSDNALFSRLLVTGGETLAAGLLLAVFGISFGAALFRYQAFKLAYANWIAALAAAPVILAYPLFLVIFGRGSLTVVLIGFLAALPAVILKVLEGFEAAGAVYVRVGRSLNATPWQIYSKILFPAAMPTIFVGLRLGLIFAMLNIFGVEFLINTGGLGQLVNELSELYDLAGTYAAITVVVLVNAAILYLSGAVERRLGAQR
jgi:NitT/TauT family transport system permease protein